MSRILHLADEGEWSEAQESGAYRRSTRGLALADVGFIHTSGSHQVGTVAEAFYRHAPGPLLLLVVDVAAVERSGSPVHWEDAPGTGQQFPHIYGPLPVTAVVAAIPVGFGADGSFTLPDLAGWDVLAGPPAAPASR